jgi:tetratricopeptide (TPR) repeat protein
METTVDLFAAARLHHQAGDLEQAGRLYRRVLQDDPVHVGGLYGLGQIAQQLRRYDQAAVWLRRAVDREPANPFLWNNLGNSLGAQGRSAEAEACFHEAMQLMPDYGEAYNNLATALLVQGRLGEAVVRYRQAVLARPDYAQAWHSLGLALLRTGSPHEAAEALGEAVRLRPDWTAARYSLEIARPGQRPAGNQAGHPGFTPSATERTEGLAHFRRGIELAAADQLPEAVTALRHAQRLCPDLAEACLELGNALRQQGRVELALGYLRHALRLRPNLTPALVGLALALADAGRPEAEAAFREVLALDPGDVVAVGQLCNWLEEQGRVEEAQALLQEALVREPAAAHLRSHHGRVLMILGRLDEAQVEFHQALAQQPDLTPAYVALARDSRHPVSAEHRAAMLDLLAQPTLPLRDRINLHFALAHLHDRERDFDQAFQHCDQANAAKRQLLQRQGNTYQPAGQTQYVDRLAAAFSADFFRRAAAFGTDSELPVFIVGMPRSGTTLVEQILASHADIFGAGETRNMQRLVAQLGRPGDYPESARLLDAGSARRLAEEYILELARQGGGRARVTDKLPGNFHHLGLIAALFPRAHIVHCRRDPRDTCWSCYFHNFQEVTYNCDLKTLGSYYREYARLMAHWKAYLPVPIFDVQYEELVAEPERVSREMVAFCRLDWHDDCLRFYETRRPVRTASNLQVRQPVYKHAVEHWRHYRDQLGPLLVALGPLADG